FLGSRYLLKVIGNTRNKVEIQGKYIVIFTKNKIDSALLEKQLYSFYRKELRNRLQVMVDIYSKKMNLESPPFKIRYMKTKWGACASHNHRVWFNIELGPLYALRQCFLTAHL